MAGRLIAAMGAEQLAAQRTQPGLDRGQHLSLTGRHAHPRSHRAGTHNQILPETPPTLVSRGPGGQLRHRPASPLM